MSNPAVELERGDGPFGRSASERARLAKMAAWSFAACVALFFVIAGFRTFDATQQEMRLLPYLSYDDRVDFAYFYAAADMVRHGDLDEVYPQKYEYIFYPGDPAFDLARDDYVKARLLARGNYYNPPLVAVLEAPLTAFGFKTAFWVYSAISASVFAAFVAIFWRLGRGVPELPLVMLGIVTYLPVHETLMMGHLSLFFVFALGAGFFALRAKQPIVAGLALSLLALKPQWAILPGLFLVWRGEWRALATMAVGSAALFFIPFLATSSQAFSNYVHFLRDQSAVDLGNAPHMFSWNGFLSKLHSNYPFGAPEFDVNRPLLYSLQAITLLAVALVWWGRDLYLGVAATILGMLLVSTHSVWYDWAFLVVVAAFLALRPAPTAARAQMWLLLIAVYVSTSQSIGVVFAPDGRHGFLHWSESGFFSLTLVAFSLLLWCVGRTILDGQIRWPQVLTRASEAKRAAV